MLLVFAAVIVSAGAPPSLGEDAGPLPPFQAYVDMKTFMEHVLTPAAAVIWRVNAVVIDEKGEHDLSPKSEAEWEQIESGAATLAEATNALMIPQRTLDAQWNFYAGNLAQAASEAFRAAEARDPKAVSAVSDRLDGLCGACLRKAHVLDLAFALLCRFRCHILREFGDEAGLIVDNHHQIEIADRRDGTGARLDVGEPFGIVAALRCFFRRPDVERAAGAVFAGDIVLANKLLVVAPPRYARTSIREDLFAAPAGRVFELHEFDDHRSASLSFPRL
jgi:hypothetical protein